LEIIADNLKPVLARAVSQRLIPAGERSGLLTRIGDEKRYFKKKRERLCHPTARAPMKRGLSLPPKGSPDSLIRNASDNGGCFIFYIFGPIGFSEAGANLGAEKMMRYQKAGRLPMS
jgi:hypothetical protein